QHKFLIFAVNCAHLGCPVEWFQESGLFMCPCHGGVYYANGERASGPPPRGLYRCVYRVTHTRGLDVLEIRAPHYPTLQDTLHHPAGAAQSQEGEPCHEALADYCGHLVRRSFARARHPAANAEAPYSPGGGRADGLVVRLRERVDDLAPPPDPHRH